MKVFFTLFLFVFLICECYSSKILVVLDTLSTKTSHSQFFENLENKGYDLDFQLSTTSNKLLSYGDYNYDHVIIMAPKSSRFGGEINAKYLAEFVDSKRNLVIVAGNKLSETLREIGTQSGVEFDDDNNKVYDHFNQNENGIHTTDVKEIFSTVKAPVIFNGLAMSLDEQNELLVPILTGSKTSYSYSNEAIKDAPHTMGKNTVLVGGLQARNSARITFFGSMDMLSDKFFSAKVNGKDSGNKQISVDIMEWALGEKGILRHRNVIHHLVNKTEVPTLYTIFDEFEYFVTIETLSKNKWTPYVADDIQLELRMLDPYVRVTLKHIGEGRYYAKIKAPDTYGVFKFSLDYRREGLSHLIYENEIVIRPFRISQFERFIECAYPYYGAVFSMMAGFFVFGLVFLYTKEKDEKIKHE